MVTRNTQSNHMLRSTTFVNTIKTEFPGIEVVADVLTHQDNQKAYTAVMQTAQKYPDLGAVFSPEGPSGRGAAQAAVELGGKIKVLTCDMDATILQMIEAGQMFGSIQPNAYVQGYLCMMLLYLSKNNMLNPLNGTTANGQFGLNLPYVDNGLDLINKDNAKYFYTDKWRRRAGRQTSSPGRILQQDETSRRRGAGHASAFRKGAVPWTQRQYWKYGTSASASAQHRLSPASASASPPGASTPWWGRMEQASPPS